mgnify:CR=1 FL=1
MSKTGLVIVDNLLRKSSKEVLKVILHVCLVVCNYLYLQTLDYLTILYIPNGQFHFNTMDYIFPWKKKVCDLVNHSPIMYLSGSYSQIEGFWNPRSTSYI